MSDFSDDFGPDFGPAAATTSGTSSWNINVTGIIRRALRQIGAFATGEVPDAFSFNDALLALNAMVKEWDALGIHLWTESEAILFLQPGQVIYQLGNNLNAQSPDRATQMQPPNFTQTTNVNQLSFGQTVVQLTSAANIFAGDNIGITMESNNSFFWTTVAAPPSGNNVTLSSALPGASAAQSIVVDYTLPVLRPLRVVSARRFNLPSLIETPMILMSRLDYQDLPNKYDTGTPTQFFYNPAGGAVPYGLAYVWPSPVTNQDAVRFTWYRQIQDFDTQNNIADLPQEWINALTWNLALELGPEYDCPADRYQIIEKRAAVSLDRVQGFDREIESVRFGPQLDGQPFSR